MMPLFRSRAGIPHLIRYRTDGGIYVSCTLPIPPSSAAIQQDGTRCHVTLPALQYTAEGTPTEVERRSSAEVGVTNSGRHRHSRLRKRRTLCCRSILQACTAGSDPYLMVHLYPPLYPLVKTCA
jgi:hypothetical protein